MTKKQNLNLKLFELLVCPLTRGPLCYDAIRNELVSPLAKLVYPIRDGVPILLVEEARDIEEKEIELQDKARKKRT